MMTTGGRDIEEKQVVEANITYHTALAKTYDEKQPHFRAENVARVEKIIAGLANKTGGGSLLDLGCGTGFIITIAKKYFRRVVGVDITEAMLERVDIRGGAIELYQADTSKIPLPAEEFDVCVAYGFLHHLYDLRPTLSEAYRCLRPGGKFYSDQDPNYYYWWLMESLKERNDLPKNVQREVQSVVSVTDEIFVEAGVALEDTALAEFQKIKKGGFDADVIVSLMQEIGFESVSYNYEWFIGQGSVLHQQSVADVHVIENFLREGLPATRHLFKYIAFFAEKGS